jgi:outer membrane lipoprotein-sorting protein
VSMAGNPLFGQEGLKKGDDPALLIEKVKKFSENTRSITSDFTQEKEMSFMEETVFSSGKFFFEKEKKLRWEYTKPYSYIIIINGSMIRIIDEGKKKDFDTGSNRMFLEISEVMSGMVNGTLLSSDQFTSVWGEGPDHFHVVMTPKSTVMKDYISRVELILNKRDYSVDELKMIEKTGDYTLIRFQNKKINEAIPAGIFVVD